MEKVSFEPAGDATRVELNVQERQDTIVVEGTYSTDDPVVIAALEASPWVKRAKAKPKAKKAKAEKPPEPQPAAEPPPETEG